MICFISRTTCRGNEHIIFPSVQPYETVTFFMIICVTFVSWISVIRAISNLIDRIFFSKKLLPDLVNRFSQSLLDTTYTIVGIAIEPTWLPISNDSSVLSGSISSQHSICDTASDWLGIGSTVSLLNLSSAELRSVIVRFFFFRASPRYCFRFDAYSSASKFLWLRFSLKLRLF